jgi:hypothetical protein
MIAMLVINIRAAGQISETIELIKNCIGTNFSLYFALKSKANESEVQHCHN